MSLTDNDFTGLARTIGQLRLQAEEAAPRKGPRPTVIVAGDETVRALRSRLDEARTCETKALLLLSQVKKDLAASQEQASEYKRHIERLEAEARGMAMKISDIERRPPQRVEVPVPVQAECQVCASIRAMVLGAKPAEPPVTIRRPIRTKAIVLAALERAERPMTADDIADAAGLRIDQVYQATWKMMQADDSPVLRLGRPGNAKSGQPGYVYWLADRPLPEGVGQ